jgi:hypothetical protein
MARSAAVSAKCPSCDAPVDADARFCSSCGARLDAGETQAVPLPPTEPGPVPMRHVQVEPRLFGVIPPSLTLVLGSVLALVGIILLATGGLVSGLLVLVIAALLLTLFFGAAQHAPASPLATKALSAVDYVKSWAGFLGGSASAWSAAGREVLRLRAEIRGLRPQRDDVQFALGGAAYRENEAEAASLRAHLRDLDRAIAERESACERALARARKVSRRERVAVQATERIEPQGAADGDSAEPPGKDAA